MDLAFLILTTLLVAGTYGYLRLCARLEERR